MNFYLSVFKNSGIVDIVRFGEAGPGPKGTVMAISFRLEGQDFMALNGGPMDTFPLAISFFVAAIRKVTCAVSGRRSRAGERRSLAAGCRTSPGLPGRQFPPFLAKC